VHFCAPFGTLLFEVEKSRLKQADWSSQTAQYVRQRMARDVADGFSAHAAGVHGLEHLGDFGFTLGQAFGFPFLGST
jgi:hypothetical protein